MLHTTGCAAIMVGAAAQGNPWLLRELADGTDQQPSNDEIVAELVRFAREVVHEIGERRAVPFLRKFHRWYLRRGTFARTLRTSSARSRRSRRSRRGCSPRRRAPARWWSCSAAADAVDHERDAELGLPISIYGGG